MPNSIYSTNFGSTQKLCATWDLWNMSSILLNTTVFIMVKLRLTILLMYCNRSCIQLVPSVSWSKRSIFQTFRKVHCCPDFLFLELDFKFWLLANFLISFNCAKFQQHWKALILDILYVLMFFDFVISQKFIGGTLMKCLISMLSNLVETLHS